MTLAFCPAGARTKSAGIGSNSKPYTCCLPALMPGAVSAGGALKNLVNDGRPPRDSWKHLPSVSASLRDRVGPQPSIYLHRFARLTTMSATVCIAGVLQTSEPCAPLLCGSAKLHRLVDLQQVAALQSPLVPVLQQQIMQLVSALNNLLTACNAARLLAA